MFSDFYNDNLFYIFNVMSFIIGLLIIREEKNHRGEKPLRKSMMFLAITIVLLSIFLTIKKIQLFNY